MLTAVGWVQCRKDDDTYALPTNRDARHLSSIALKFGNNQASSDDEVVSVVST
jgi:hypothetical protein